MDEIYFYEICCTKEEAEAFYNNLACKLRRFNYEKDIDYFRSKVKMDCVTGENNKEYCMLTVNEFDINCDMDYLYEELENFACNFKETNKNFDRFFEVKFSADNIIDIIKGTYKKNRLVGIDLFDYGDI